MLKLSDLVWLHKLANVDVRYSNIICDDVDDEKNRRRRVLEQDGRYYLHEMIDGKVTACFEVGVDWKIKPGKFQFAFTPDDRHVYYFIQGERIEYYVRKLDIEQICVGDRCSYNGMTIEFCGDEKLLMNNTLVAVEHHPDFTYRLQRKKIQAINAAKGLFIFLEHIAEEAKAGTFPLFSGAWDKIFDYYEAR